ncbi:hypothetical protein BSNK01_11860 [Bacillaceae bacterium]
MKRLLIDGQSQEGFEAERIVVDKTNGTIIGYNGTQEVFALRGVDFSLLNYEVEGGEDLPEPSETELIEQENAMLALELAATQVQLEQTEQDNAFLTMELAAAQAQLEQTEATQADLILQLIEKGVL